MKSLILAFAIALAAASTARADANLIINGEFDSDVVPWIPVNENFSVVWDSADSAGLPTSGSARVTSRQMDAGGPSSGGAGAVECIRVVEASYAVSALYFIPSGQNHTAEPDVAVAWFDDTACVGGVLGQGLVPQGASTTDSWLPLSGDVMAPAGAMSANVILRPRKVEAQASVEDPGVDVLFDAVQFVPEPGAAALGVTAAAAIAIRRRRLSCSPS